MKALLKNAIKVLALPTLCCVAGSSAYASQLTPEQALQLLRAGGNRVAPLSRPVGGSAQLRLAYTQMDLHNAIPAVYVFDRAGAPGFRIVAADDCIGDILLGYSDTENFDPNNIPDGLRWLMGAYAQYISQAVADGVVARANVSYNAVEPMTKTQWNQDEPFNNMCPIVEGGRSVTGCVATAMAQVMKVHNYPAAGTGSNSYKWTVNGTSYSLSTDFASHTYDWDNMLDVYDASSTAVQNDAVALLMADCGAAVNMSYTPQESGAASTEAATGLINYFDYDKSMRYYQRQWFSAEEWSDILYQQMCQGTPVLFAGADKEAGHEFVIDGCDASGMFHVNWGWGGIANGYYSITDLTPTQTGIGAGFGSYNESQNIIVDIKPNAGGTAVPVMSVFDIFEFDKGKYSGNFDQVILRGGFASYSLVPQEVQLGLKLTNESDTEYILIGSCSLGMLYYLPELTLEVKDFPAGEYEVSPVFRGVGGEWQDMYFDEPTSPRSIHVTKSGTTLVVGDGEIDEDPVVIDLTAEATGIFWNEAVDGIYAGHTYHFKYDVKAQSACKHEVTTVLYDADGESIGYGEFVSVSFEEAGTESISTSLHLKPSLAAGSYRFCLSCLTKEFTLEQISPMYIIEVGREEIPATAISLNETDVNLGVGETVQLTATVTPENTTDTEIVWMSSDESIATVDNNGLVTTMALGSTTITATCGKVSATCNVNVLSTEGVSDLTSGVISCQIVGNQLSVNGLADGETFKLYRIDGTLVYAGNGSVPVAANTTYVLISNGRSVKVSTVR